LRLIRVSEVVALKDLRKEVAVASDLEHVSVVTVIRLEVAVLVRAAD
jgi:hypothetical protein